MYDYIIIIDINSSQVYNFNIKQKEKMILKKDPSELLDNVNNLNNLQNGGDEFVQLKNEIEQIKNRITVLENRK
jgi:tRNA(Phe) wybutosine-synthesizing methylase Tyw3